MTSYNGLTLELGLGLVSVVSCAGTRGSLSYRRYRHHHRSTTTSSLVTEQQLTIVTCSVIATHAQIVSGCSITARLKIRGRCSKKSIKQLNRASISVSLGLGLVLGLPSSDIVLKSTVLSSLCVPHVLITINDKENRNSTTSVNGLSVFWCVLPVIAELTTTAMNNANNSRDKNKQHGRLTSKNDQ